MIAKLFNSNKFICKIDSWWLINWVSAESAVEMYKACLNWITSNFPRINFVRLFWYLPHQTVDDLLVFPDCPIQAGNTGRGGFWGRKRCTTLKIISNWNVEFLASFYFFSSFNRTLAQACIDTKFCKNWCQNSLSLLTNKTWRGSTLTDWNVLIILLPCKKNVGTFIENQTGENFDTNMRPIHSPTIQGHSHCCAWLTLDLITLEGK